jgi:hypothetical protein
LPNVSRLQATKPVGRGIRNYIAKRPLAVGFEVTLSSNLVARSMHRIKYATQKQMAAGFSGTNDCDSCYCDLTSYSEPSFLDHMKSIPDYTRRSLV